MKKVVLLLLALLSVLMLAVGCGGSQNDDDLPALEGVTLNAKGVLSWEAVAEAQEYKVVISDGTNVGEPKTVTENKFDLLSTVAQAGSYTASIKAYAGTTALKAGDFAFTAVKLGTPSKPVLETDSVTHLEKFVWQSNDTNTRNYLQSINDGRWVTNVDGFYEISATGSYSISVKAKAYANGKVLYLESDASEKSETVIHLQGPVLRVESMNVIRWSSDTDFDSYNLWINGQKAKESVVCDSEGYNLITGADPAITKTGEYNLQIEAIKDGESYFSNILEEVGTHNINENELYSFDNRKADFTAIKEGVSISDEQYHGDSGYSLRLEFTQNEQLNFKKYAYEGFQNDIDYSRIKKISYWVYVPSIAGYEGETFPKNGLPRWRWEKLCKDAEGNDAYKITMFEASDDIPFDTWTKVEIDNLENIKDPQVFIMSIVKVLEQNCVIYVDDIRYEELYAEDAVTDADYVVEYNPAAAKAGSWQGFNYTTIDLGADYANQTVAVAMYVCGTANANAGTEFVGFFFDSAPNNHTPTTDYYRRCIDAAKISSTDAWNQILINVTTDAEGKAYCTGMFWGSPLPDGVTRSPYKIYVKNVAVVDGTALIYGGVNKTNSAKHQSATGLSTDLPVGTAVSVTMDVYVTGTFDASSKIYVVDSVWSTDGGERNAVTDIMSTIVTGESGWHKVTFTATVRNFPNLRHNANYETIIDTSSFGNAVYLLTDNGSVAAFSYKNVTITKLYDSMINGGKNSVNNYYQSMTGLKTDLDVGTSVTVTMEVKLTSASAFDQYSSLYWVDSVYSSGAGAVENKTSIRDLIADLTDTTNWQTITFTATVRNFEQLRANTSQYNSVDTSSFGNAVYILAQANGTGNPLYYRNVTITAA